jgi:predicted alpha/beta-hydrolase family hydrolase
MLKPSTDRRRIDVDPGIQISSVWAFPEEFSVGESTALILAHGAGSNMDYPFLSFVHEALASRGILTVKFNFPYVEAGRKVPDPPALLAHAWRAIIGRVRSEARPGALFLGGRSMGGRIATNVVADGEPASGLVLLGYPLHPAGRLDALRARHLERIACPMLFIQGSRDKLCDLSTLRSVLAPLSAPITLHLIEEGDHSFKVPKRTGKTEADVRSEIVETVASWLAGVAGTTR